MKGTCQWCGQGFEYELRGQKRKYCDRFCAKAYKSANRKNNTLPRECTRCKITKPRNEFDTPRMGICSKCKGEEVHERECIRCKQTKSVDDFPYWSKMCISCKAEDGKYVVRENECQKCKHYKDCIFLTERKIAPLCWSYDDDLDPHYYGLLPAGERVKAAGIMGLRYYEKFKEVQKELL